MNQTADRIWEATLRDLLVLRDVAALRAVAHDERLEMLAALTERPHTATTIARRLGMEPNRAAYHLKRLLEVGLIQPAGRGRKRWKEERFFVAVARHLVVDPALTCHDPETTATILRGIENGVLDWRRREILDIDLGQVARIVVQDCMRVAANERVLVLFSPAGLELAECVLVELEALGAIGRLKPWSRNWVLRTIDRHDETGLARLSFASEDEDRDLGGVIFISQMMPQGAPPNPEQRARLPHLLDAISRWQQSLRERGVKYLEIGLPWSGEFQHHTSPEIAIDTYWRCLVTDPGELHARAHALLDHLGGEEGLRIVTPGGGDLHLRIDTDRAAVNDGVIDAADLAAGRPVAHIPAGLLEFLPAGRDARGTFHAAYAFLAGRRFRGVRVTLRDGRIVEVDGDDDAGIIRDRLRTESGEPDRLAGFSIGLNPAGADLTGKASLDACLAGTVTISFGNNELRGGDVRSSLDLQLPAGAATVVTAGGIELVRHGQLVTGEEPGPAPGRAAPVP